MPIPEGYLPREGDVVVVHATVKYDVDPKTDSDEDGPKVFIRPIGGYTDHRVPVKTLVGIYSRHFDEGIRVRPIVEPSVSGTVVATSDDSVWVKIDATETIPEHFETYRSENLEPVPVVEDLHELVEQAPPPAPGSMRFAINDRAILARPPSDPLRAEGITPYIGRTVRIAVQSDGDLYKIAVLGAGAEFFVSDDMLDPLPPPKRIDEEGVSHR